MQKNICVKLKSKLFLINICLKSAYNILKLDLQSLLQIQIILILYYFYRYYLCFNSYCVSWIPFGFNFNLQNTYMKLERII